MLTASFQHPLIKLKYLCIQFPLSHGSRRKGLSTSMPCFLLGNPKAFVCLVKLSCCIDSSRYRHIHFYISLQCFYTSSEVCPLPRFNHGPLLAQGNELFRQKNENLARNKTWVGREHLESSYTTVLPSDQAVCSELQWRTQWWIISVLPSPLGPPPGGFL